MVSAELDLQQSNWAIGDDNVAMGPREGQDEEVDMSDLWVSDKLPLTEKTKKSSWSRKLSKFSKKERDVGGLTKHRSGRKYTFTRGGSGEEEETSFAEHHLGQADAHLQPEQEIGSMVVSRLWTCAGVHV